MPYPRLRTTCPMLKRWSALLAGLLLLSSCGPDRPGGTFASGERVAPTSTIASSSAAAPSDASPHTHHASSSAQPSVAAQQPALATPNAAAPTSRAPAPSITLSGSGENQTELFSLAPGLAVFHFDHPAATPFAAFLLNEQGEHLALLANGTAFSGRQVFGIKAGGRYTLHMIAQDEWQARVEQPDPAMLEREATARGVVTGQGSTATSPMLLNQGVQRVEWTQSGSFPATFLLWSLDGQQRVEIVVNSTAAEGTATITLPVTSAYVLNAQTNGAWTVAFSQP